MIAFTPLTAATFQGFVDYFVPDYAAEIVTSYQLSETEALAHARQEIENSFPLAENTPGQTLLCITQQENNREMHIGYLWYKTNALQKSVFINEFYLFAPFRNKGLGRKALIALEERLKHEGCHQIQLRVAGDNAQARHVYETSGFRVTGVNMNKVL
ncbi:GNAT family N-acetyltransferase [Yokenella regensburgei]|uniref:GNAT family N-acetyltransferase n=1 Tax=Yokenella regensburgei TaxID=158877 RepID=UPI003F144FA8